MRPRCLPRCVRLAVTRNLSRRHTRSEFMHALQDVRPKADARALLTVARNKRENWRCDRCPTIGMMGSTGSGSVSQRTVHGSFFLPFQFRFSRNVDSGVQCKAPKPCPCCSKRLTTIRNLGLLRRFRSAI